MSDFASMLDYRNKLQSLAKKTRAAGVRGKLLAGAQARSIGTNWSGDLGHLNRRAGRGGLR